MKTLTTAILGAICALMVGPAFARTPDLPSCDSWRPACSGNYTNSSRPSSYPIQYVVIHKVQGSAASAASWFQNCAANVSAHFIYNNSTGYCYQSVREADIGWHAGNWTYNTRSVGIEHGGFVSNNDTATVCYNESALETKSCIIYYDVLHNRNRIVGHSEVPGASHTDPGQYWNWSYYMSKCDPTPPPSGASNYVDGSPSTSANWVTGTSAADKHGSNYKWRSTALISDPASFTVSIPSGKGGSYDVSAWWPQGSNRSPNAPYIMPGGAVVTRNQQANGGKWNKLKTINVSAGNRTVQLSCWVNDGFIVVADAVKFYGPK